MTQALHLFEEKIFHFINGNHTAFLDYLMVSASNLFLFIPIIILIAFVSAWYYKHHGYYHHKANSVMLMIILLCGFLFCFFVLPQIFPYLLDRTKPCLNPNISTWLRLVNNDCNDVNGSFALRPCIMFCITSFLFFSIKDDLKKTKAFLVILSILVSYSRIYLGVHYPGNVLLADIIGIICGFITSRLYFYVKYDILPF
jgi:undecaprenyl-diphosphatase